MRQSSLVAQREGSEVGDDDAGERKLLQLLNLNSSMRDTHFIIVITSVAISS